MSREREAITTSGPAGSSVRRPDDDDPTEERIEAELVAHLHRGASPEAYARAVAQQEALRAQKAALRREVAEDRAQVRRLSAYMDLLLYADVSGYTEQQLEEYRRELHRRRKDLFGK